MEIEQNENFSPRNLTFPNINKEIFLNLDEIALDTLS